MSMGAFPGTRRLAGRALRSYTAATSSPVTARVVEVLVDLAAGREVPWHVPDVMALLAAGAWRFGAWRPAFVAGAQGGPR